MVSGKSKSFVSGYSLIYWLTFAIDNRKIIYHFSFADLCWILASLFLNEIDFELISENSWKIYKLKVTVKSKFLNWKQKP